MSTKEAPPIPKKTEAIAERELARRTRRNAWDQKFSPYLYISPFFILFALVGLFPLVYTAYVSVHDWNLIGGKGDFVGLENYQTVVQQPLFWKGLRNTFSIFLLSSVPQVLIGLFLAAMLDANLRAKTFWRMGVLLPYVVMPVAVGMIFNKIFADQSGMANAILANFGIEPIRWHADVLASHIAIATMVDFRWTGYTTLILLAGMQAIPNDLYEAAVVDGAGPLAVVPLDHDPVAEAHDHLRGDHLDHRRPADLRRAAHVRPDRPGRIRPAVDDGDDVPLRARVGSPEELRPSLGRGVDPVPDHPGHRGHQLQDHPANLRDRLERRQVMSSIGAVEQTAGKGAARYAAAA